jgi:predicted naringenin-chalcone synthase
VRPEVVSNNSSIATDSQSGTSRPGPSHSGGPRILDRVGQALDFDAGDLATSRVVLADHGNCSSATILMILEQLRAHPMVSGANVVAIGVGPGLTAAAMLFRSG